MASIPNIPLVVFLDILDQYSFNSDLTCSFRISPDLQTRAKGNVAIFKLGWIQITEYVAIKSVPEIPFDRICTVTFNRHVLPKNTSDLYQICYIAGNDLHGASTPFQFYSEDNLVTFDCGPSKALASIESMKKPQTMTEKDQEVNRLKEENSILRESLKVLLKNGSKRSNSDKDFKEIKKLVENLNAMVLTHDKDIQMLKEKIIAGCEEYKKLYLEKYKIQKKYERLKHDRGFVLEDQPPINDFNLDLGDLKSIPPFPADLRHLHE